MEHVMENGSHGTLVGGTIIFLDLTVRFCNGNCP